MLFDERKISAKWGGVRCLYSHEWQIDGTVRIPVEEIEKTECGSGFHIQNEFLLPNSISIFVRACYTNRK
jgi:hypothetical protein